MTARPQPLQSARDGQAGVGDRRGLARQTHPPRPDLRLGALHRFSTRGVRLVRALPFPAPASTAHQRTPVAALHLAPESDEAEAEAIVRAGRFGHYCPFRAQCSLAKSNESWLPATTQTVQRTPWESFNGTPALGPLHASRRRSGRGSRRPAVE